MRPRTNGFPVPRRWLALAAASAWLALGGLAGCDSHRANQLVEDVSTEADVRRQFGEPRTVTIAPDGTRTLDYPRQPEGVANYVMVIGPDGKLKSLRQLLNPDNFAKVRPGMDRDAVSRLLGPHARERRFDLKRETVVEWRFEQDRQVKVFGVTFDESGKVTGTDVQLDPKQTQTGG